MSAASTFFPAHLLHSKQRLATTPRAYVHHLDKNEQADDVPGWLKLQVLQKAMDMEWNRYPSLDYSDIEQQIAATIGVESGQVVLGAGSATFITTLLNFFGMQRRQLVIAQPSYSLFDYHCKTYGIPYTPWMLNGSLEYDEALLPELEEGSVVFVVSPNNPVGNTIPKSMLQRILRNNPQTLVILDAVYAEFEDAGFNDLLRQFSNLLILRSFSKELPIAGLRLGYLCGNHTLLDIVRKLLLPFTINALSLAFARHMMFEPEFRDWAADTRDGIKTERERVYRCLKQQLPAGVATVYRSGGNFLLISVHSDSSYANLLRAFESAGIKVLDTSSMPLLKNTFRVSIGSEAANSAVITCVLDVLQTACNYANVHSGNAWVGR